jgi:hypothetical protein
MDKGPITGARIVTMPTPTGTTPAMIYSGDVPEKGDPQPGAIDGAYFRKNVSIRCRAIFQRTP